MTARPAWYGDPSPAGHRALRELAALPADDGFAALLASQAAGRLVSAIVPTYNRCPFDPADRIADNPLYWAVTTLRSQAGGVLAEIVVADDGSTDHTPAVLDQLTACGHPVPVRWIRCPDHQGAWRARNAAAAAARCSLLYFADDDCVFPPHAVAGAASALAVLRRADPAAAAVNTPFYYRALRPRAVLPASRIGTLDLEAATFSTGFHAMPSGYLDGLPPVLGPSRLLKPLRVQLIGGTALIDATALRAAGGFADVSAWATGYSDHLHLSADLAAAGAHLYHCPDPRLGAAHLKFGAPGAYSVDDGDLDTPIGALGRPFGDLVALSAVPRAGSGHRVSDGEFFREQIGSFFAFFAVRSAAGGRAWAIRSWHEFAAEGQVPTLAVSGVPGPAERALAWREGLAAGARTLTRSPRHGIARDVVEGLLREVSDECGQPAITDW
jgi:glycosyl transferase family 2